MTNTLKLKKFNSDSNSGFMEKFKVFSDDFYDIYYYNDFTFLHEQGDIYYKGTSKKKYLKIFMDKNKVEIRSANNKDEANLKIYKGYVFWDYLISEIYAQFWNSNRRWLMLYEKNSKRFEYIDDFKVDYKAKVVNFWKGLYNYEKKIFIENSVLNSFRKI